MDASLPPADQGPDDGLGGALTLRCSARPLRAAEPGQPAAPTPLTLIPYHLWANRGPTSMRVWLPQRR